MRLREVSRIERPPDAVWARVIDPASFRQWNDKVVSMDVGGEFRIGQPFTTHYRWKGKEMQCLSVVTALVPGRLLEIRHSQPVGEKLAGGLEVTERIRLTQRGGDTIVRKDIVIRHHDVPWFLLPLIWFVSWFGTPVGPDRLKALCEES